MHRPGKRALLLVADINCVWQVLTRAGLSIRGWWRQRIAPPSLLDEVEIVGTGADDGYAARACAHLVELALTTA